MIKIYCEDCSHEELTGLKAGDQFAFVQDSPAQSLEVHDAKGHQ